MREKNTLFFTECWRSAVSAASRSSGSYFDLTTGKLVTPTAAASASASATAPTSTSASTPLAAGDNLKYSLW